MAKRKNPLKDLDAFLKKEASSLVTPDEVSKSKETEAIANTPTLESLAKDIRKEDIVSLLQLLAEKEGSSFKHTLCEIFLETLESTQNKSAEDKMLINTLLYVSDKDHWKENIKTYWSK